MGVTGLACDICRSTGRGCRHANGRLVCYGPASTVIPRNLRLVGNLDDGSDARVFEQIIAGQDIPVNLRAATLQRPAPVLVKMSDVEPQAIRWLWPGRIARKTITMIFGPPGKGKSFVCHDIAARVSTGRAWPNDRATAQDVGSVVLLTCEDDLAMVVRPRLERSGADLSRITALRAVRDEKGEEQFFNLDTDLPVLRQAIDETPDTSVLVIDPIQPFMGRRTDTNKHGEVYASLRPLIDVAEAFNLAVVCVQHTNKGTAPNALARTMGSTAFTALCRNAWFICADADNDRDRLLVHGKASLGPTQPGLRFTIDATGTLCWYDGDVDLTADEVYAADALAGRDDKGALDIACEWLRDQLRGGPVLSRDVDGKASAEGIAIPTLKRAKAKLGVKATQYREDKKLIGWVITLPGRPETHVPE